MPFDLNKNDSFTFCVRNTGFVHSFCIVAVYIAYEWTSSLQYWVVAYTFFTQNVLWCIEDKLLIVRTKLWVLILLCSAGATSTMKYGTERASLCLAGFDGVMWPARLRKLVAESDVLCVRCRTFWILG